MLAVRNYARFEPASAAHPRPQKQHPAEQLSAEQLSADQAWQQPSWDEVVRTHSARVFRLAYRLTGNRHDAEDLTHDVFVRVFRSLSSYTPGTFEGWLHRITVNAFLDGQRRRARIRFDPLSEDADPAAPASAGVEASFAQRNLDIDVAAALAALPPNFRAAVVLCDLEGLSYEEIAATLGVKPGTVRSRIHRGRALLREALAPRYAPQALLADGSARDARLVRPSPA